MKIAIVGNGHLGAGSRPPAAPRARDHRLRGGGADRRSHPHGARSKPPTGPTGSTPASSSSTTATTPTSKRCWRSSGWPASPRTWASRSPTAGRFEYSGTPWGLFARPAHLLSPSFLGMLRDWRRFNREARALIGMNGTAPSLGALARAGGLLPPLHRPADRPPGLRRLVGRPGADVELPGQLHGRVLREPRHVQPPRPAAAGGPSAGGSRSYVEAITAPWRDRVRPRRRCGGSSACRTGCGSRPTAARARSFDRVVIATHSDQALALLGDPSAAEREVLGAIPYQRNEAVLHTDASLMPRRRAAWSSWNFHLSRAAGAGGSTVTYWMNKLQRLRTEQRLLRHPEPRRARSTRRR